MPKSVAAPPPAPRNRHFYMSAGLDPTRINRDVQKLVEEVISQLANSPGAQLEITLEVDAKSTDGFPVETVRTVVENCRTLSITKCGFDEG
ncbi:MAG: hypothetical protein LBU23_03720, partial [Planctomycetota bacterium]|jgi:hypothetical protein|nr:hypothetical protein [Planctomycetota bacterium]